MPCSNFVLHLGSTAISSSTLISPICFYNISPCVNTVRTKLLLLQVFLTTQLIRHCIRLVCRTIDMASAGPLWTIRLAWVWYPRYAFFHIWPSSSCAADKRAATKKPNPAPITRPNTNHPIEKYKCIPLPPIIFITTYLPRESAYHCSNLRY